MRRSLVGILVLVWLAGCAVVARHYLDEQYGTADPRRFDEPPVASAPVAFQHDVMPVLERRCAVCHGCYDAPCQLKLTAWQGVLRGASEVKVYDGARLREAEPSRLFEDAVNISHWRQRGFYPVINEREDSPEANRAGSVLARMLALKAQHPLPAAPVLPDSFDFSLGRKQSCPRIETMDQYEREQPLAGMPYGLPAIPAAEQQTLLRWVEAGAPFEPLPALPAAVEQQRLRWETFLNQDAPKVQLASRYIYEHLFIGSLYFAGAPVQLDGEPYYFHLVRSATPPGEPLQKIVTRRPYDDPGVARVYYRLERQQEVTLQKTHMPYRLDDARLAQWRRWFVEAPYTVQALPDYSVPVSANPFIAFADLPAESRYRFLLDEAEFTIMGFIKGPVCRGQTALNVINDQFWVFFLDPATAADPVMNEYFREHAEDLRLPTELESNAPVLSAWRDYAKAQRRYLDSKSRQIVPAGLKRWDDRGIELFWDGERSNPNAALTVFRHFDSATVVQGLVGDEPKTVWVIGYPLLERLHYLLVAGFDVYGNVGHQLNTRLYMDFLRMEGEFNFLALLPSKDRQALTDYWYRGADEHVKAFVSGNGVHYDDVLPVRYRTDNPKQELLDRLRAHIPAAQASRYSLAGVKKASVRKSLQGLAAVHGESLRWLPQVVVLRVTSPGGSEWFTVLNNSAYSNIAQIFREDTRRLPAEDTLTVVRGFIGAYPNAFWEVAASELPALAESVRHLGSEADYAALMDRYGVRRTAPAFWDYSDALHTAMRQSLGVSFGMMDYNRLENR